MSNLNIIFDLMNFEGSNSANPDDSCKVTNVNQDVDITDFVRYQKVLPDGTTDQVVPIADPASEYLAILTDREITIKLNGSTDPITLVPRGNGIKTFAYFTKGAVSSLTISNGSSASANVDVITANK